MSAETEVADAVADTIRSANITGVSFGDVRRTYLDDLTLRDAETTRVTVVPGLYERQNVSRSRVKEMYGIDVVVMKRAATDAEADTVMSIVEQIKRVFEPAGSLLGSVTDMFWLGVTRSTLFDDERMDELRMLATVVRHMFITYRTI